MRLNLQEVVNCGTAQSCSVGNSQSISYTIGWTATLTPVSWISGGFSVSESWSTGNTYTCTGSAGEDVCVWYNTAHTACKLSYKGFRMQSPTTKEAHRLIDQ